MSEKLAVFENEQFGEVRALLIDGEPWFVAKDVATALGYADTDQAIRKNCKKAETYPVESTGQVRHVVIIPESDIFRLIVRSRLPQAEQYQDWVCEEVLPTLRRTGFYSMAQVEGGESDELPSIASIAPELSASIQMAKELGFAGKQAILAGAEAVKRRHNVDVLELVGTPIPGSEHQDRMLTPTDVGRLVGMSGHVVNRVLCRMGMQVRIRKPGVQTHWALTDIGQEYGCYLNKARSSSTMVRKVFWFPIVADLMRKKIALEVD